MGSQTLTRSAQRRQCENVCAEQPCLKQLCFSDIRETFSVLNLFMGLFTRH